MIHYCSCVDDKYLSRALCLYDSLQRHSLDFHWYVLALNSLAEDGLKQFNLQNVTVMPLDALEQEMPMLLKARSNRKWVEYCYTLKSAFLIYLMQGLSHCEMISYLDSDLYFLRDPSVLYEEMVNCSVGITLHNFSKYNCRFLSGGLYNAGWVTFRKDTNGLLCLEDWFCRCLDWCFDRRENGLFSDQKYLEAWPSTFDGVHVVEHLGANVAPWNITNFFKENERMMSDSEMRNIVFIHFQRIRHLESGFFDLGLDVYVENHHMRRFIVSKFYRPYLRSLRGFEVLLNDMLAGSIRVIPSFIESLHPISLWPKEPSGWMRFPFRVVRKIWASEWLFVRPDRSTMDVYRRGVYEQSAFN